MLGKIVSPNSYSHASLSQNRLILVIVLILSVSERNSFRTSIVRGKSGKTSSGIRIAKKERKKTKGLKEGKKDNYERITHARRGKSRGRENGGIGDSLWRKEQERGWNVECFNDWLVNQGLTRAENCCSCKICRRQFRLISTLLGTLVTDIGSVLVTFKNLSMLKKDLTEIV